MCTFLLFESNECLSSLQEHSGSLADGEHSSDYLTVILPLIFILTPKLHLCVRNLDVDLKRWTNTLSDRTIMMSVTLQLFVKNLCLLSSFLCPVVYLYIGYLVGLSEGLHLH